MTRKENRKHSTSDDEKLPPYIEKIEARGDKEMDAHTGSDGKVDRRKMTGEHMSTSKDKGKF